MKRHTIRDCIVAALKARGGEDEAEMKNHGVRVWLARDDYGNYLLCTMRPRYFNGDWVKQHTSVWYYFCNKNFERVTGYKLQSGECKRVRINIEDCK